jgi:hypothetical protein
MPVPQKLIFLWGAYCNPARPNYNFDTNLTLESQLMFQLVL